jgi:hypothetical protein
MTRVPPFPANLQAGAKPVDGFEIKAVKRHGKNTYLLVHHPSRPSWPRAQEAAQRMGGHLVTISDGDENESVRGLLPFDNEFCWIGCTRGTGGRWTWVTEEPFVYCNWKKGEPNNCDGVAENWGMMYCGTTLPGQWTDISNNPREPLCWSVFEIEGERSK